MKNKTISLIKITSLFLIAVLLLFFKANNVPAAGLLVPKQGNAFIDPPSIISCQTGILYDGQPAPTCEQLSGVAIKFTFNQSVDTWAFATTNWWLSPGYSDVEETVITDLTFTAPANGSNPGYVFASNPNTAVLSPSFGSVTTIYSGVGNALSVHVQRTDHTIQHQNSSWMTAEQIYEGGNPKTIMGTMYVVVTGYESSLTSTPIATHTPTLTPTLTTTPTFTPTATHTPTLTRTPIPTDLLTNVPSIISCQTGILYDGQPAPTCEQLSGVAIKFTFNQSVDTWAFATTNWWLSPGYSDVAETVITDLTFTAPANGSNPGYVFGSNSNTSVLSPSFGNLATLYSGTGNALSVHVQRTDYITQHQNSTWMVAEDIYEGGNPRTITGTMYVVVTGYESSLPLPPITTTPWIISCQSGVEYAGQPAPTCEQLSGVAIKFTFNQSMNTNAYATTNWWLSPGYSDVEETVITDLTFTAPADGSDPGYVFGSNPGVLSPSFGSLTTIYSGVGNTLSVHVQQTDYVTQHANGAWTTAEQIYGGGNPRAIMGTMYVVVTGYESQLTPTPPPATPTFTPTSTPTLTPTSYSYNRATAAAYADDWAYLRNSTYPLANETGCGCNDCTNYISQILHEGGYPLRPGNDPENDSQWWYVPDDNNPSTQDYSNTWSATEWFKFYVDNFPNEFVVNPNPPIPQAGDFILLDLRNNTFQDIMVPDGRPDHARALVGYGSTSIDPQDYTDGCGALTPVPTQEYFLLADQHCVDRKHVRWDYNLNPDTTIWYIHVTDN